MRWCSFPLQLKPGLQINNSPLSPFPVYYCLMLQAALTITITQNARLYAYRIGKYGSHNLYPMCSPNSQSVLSLWVWCALVDSTQCYPTNTPNETALISAETSENIASLSQKRLVTLTLLAALTLLLEVATFVLSRTERKVHESELNRTADHAWY